MLIRSIRRCWNVESAVYFATFKNRNFHILNVTDVVLQQTLLLPKQSSQLPGQLRQKHDFFPRRSFRCSLPFGFFILLFVFFGGGGGL